MRRALVAALVAVARPAAAQISPGDLSTAHAKLEGSTQCLACHDRAQGVAARRCLVCHAPLRQQIAAGKGLHARNEYRECKACHVEHQGRAADLVWWGKQGRGAFDHAQTGYVLEGAHARVACEACHRLPAAGARTFLGLASACTACHADVHRGQLGAGQCRSCHGMDTWKPAPGFDHARTRFPLTGHHDKVSCEKCHAGVKDTSGGVSVRYSGIAFESCTSCHEDPHRARLGTSCASCHDTRDWRGVKRTSFDHERTRYPLRGRHAAVACEKCHAPGRSLTVAHARCTDCHSDAHAGEFARRADAGRCETCHDVQGFIPARFGNDEHRETAYPLTGAHLAVGCDACHRRSPGRRTATYRVAFARCTDCHKDPHRGELDRWMSAAGCESCHRMASWRLVDFDHAVTRFPLADKHATVACAACHKKTDVGSPRERVSYRGVSLACAECHRDVHAAQFAVAGITRCDRCHRAANWQATAFEHNRDASYRLDGAHARVTCAGCHKPETRDGRAVVRYKPLGSECRACHSSGRTP